MSAAIPTSTTVAGGGRDRVIVFVAVLFALPWWGMVGAGVDMRNAFTIELVVAFQSLGGALLWRLARRGADSLRWPELVGAGMALGTLMSVVCAQVARTSALHTVAWALPTVVLMAAHGTRIILGRPGTTPLVAPDRAELFSLPAALLGLLFLLAPWFAANPLGGAGSRRLFVDVPFFESLAHSVTTFGPGDNQMLAGVPIRYHWLTQAWAGWTDAAAHAAPFEVMTRAAPLAAGIAVLLLAWTLARKLDGRTWVAGALAMTAVLLAGDVGTGFGRVILGQSPSLTMTSMWLLAMALVVVLGTDAVRWSPALVAVLVAAATAGKSTAGAVAVGALVVAAAMSWSSSHRRSLVMSAGAAAVALASTYALMIAGLQGSSDFVDPMATARLYGFLPTPSVIGASFGVVAVAAAVSALWAGLVPGALMPTVRQRIGWRLALGAGIAGIAMVTMLDLGGGNQTQAGVSASALIIPVSAAGVVLGLRNGGVGVRRWLPWSAAGVVMGLAVMGLSQVLPVRLAWAAPLLPWLFACLGACIVARPRGSLHSSRERLGWLPGAAIGAAILLAASLGAGSVVTVRAYAAVLRAGPIATTEPLVWGVDQIDAAAWVRANTPEDAIFATDRWCKQVPAVQPTCSPDWWLTSALTGRRVVLEGFGYWLSADSAQEVVPPRIAAVTGFLDHPNPESLAGLRRFGVTYLWLEGAIPPSDQLDQFADLRFVSGAVQVWQLHDAGEANLVPGPGPASALPLVRSS